MRVLVIEDEKGLSGIIRKGLEEQGFAVETALDGEDGLYKAETLALDALILDVMLPNINGMEILVQLRNRGIDVPVLMLTAKGDVEDRIRGLDAGADDYLAKPFDFSEMVARLRAIIRRHKGSSSAIIRVNDLVLNLNAQSVKRSGIDIPLSAREYRILEYLALNSGRVVSRSELIEHIYEESIDLDSNVIDVYINYLRNKIDRDFEVKLIRTIRGSGYIMQDNP